MKPLDDITVVEVGQVVSVPFAGMLLSDMGAEGVKVERPGTGDSQRHTTPGSHSIGDFELLNRGKKSIELNLGSEEGQEIFHELLEDADVLIENLSPGAFDRLGIPLDELAAEYESLICGSLKGFGEGPYEERLGMDHPIEVESGMTYMTGLNEHPLRVGFSVVDISTAMYMIQGVLALLRRIPSEAEKRVFTVGMFETAAMLMGQPMAYASFMGESPEPLNEGIFKWAVYDYFGTGDGEKVFIGLVSDAQWERFAEALGMEDLLDDPDLQDESGRVENRDRIHDRINEELGSRSQDEVLDQLRSIRVPYAPFQKPGDLLNDEHLLAGGKQVSWTQGDTEVRLPIPPMEGPFFQYKKEGVRSPSLGEHTNSVLEDLGYSKAEIEDLRDASAIGTKDSSE
jgi:crotonobetainyl-CoA:carnitine CoA-transferase CaiB-like acyl-CoA transferase